MSLPAPDAEFQLRFLQNVQRILEEGQFTATYKFALLHALADLAVQRGNDSGDPLNLPVRSIAERFVELYWRQVTPWPGAGEARILAQNTGGQAAIVRQVREARAEYDGGVDRLRRKAEDWRRLTGRVAAVVERMPLWKLQVVGRETRTFLYEHVQPEQRVDVITLNPGIAFCFRTFHSLVVDLVQGAWVRFIRRLNVESLGEMKELGEFLFGAQRATLEALRDPLWQLQKGRCFYCAKGLLRQAEVDHFVPWRRYPVDLGHNFVLAHGHCNRAKSDHMAAESHLEAWVHRNREFAEPLGGIFDDAGFPHDLGVSTQIARWAYGQIASRGGQVWLERKEFRRLQPHWEGILR